MNISVIIRDWIHLMLGYLAVAVAGSSDRLEVLEIGWIGMSKIVEEMSAQMV